MLVFFPGASGKENPNFYEICPTVAHGNNGYFWFANLKFRCISVVKNSPKKILYLSPVKKLLRTHWIRENGKAWVSRKRAQEMENLIAALWMHWMRHAPATWLHFTSPKMVIANQAWAMVKLHYVVITPLSINILHLFFRCPCQKQRKKTLYQQAWFHVKEKKDRR